MRFSAAASLLASVYPPLIFRAEAPAPSGHKPLPPELWPALKFVLQHLDGAMRSKPGVGPDVSDAISEAVEGIRDPEAIPVLVDALRGLGAAVGPGYEPGPLSALVGGLARIKPQGEAALWQVFDLGSDALQIAILRIISRCDPQRQLVDPLRAVDACAGLLRTKPAHAQDALSILSSLDVKPEAAAAARATVRDAYEHRPPTGPPAREYVAALIHLGDPSGDALWAYLATRRIGAQDYGSRIGEGHPRTPAALKLQLQIATSDFQPYAGRYWALRAVETKEPKLAKQIATQWSHDRRYAMRNLGRKVLAGPHQSYL